MADIKTALQKVIGEWDKAKDMANHAEHVAVQTAVEKKTGRFFEPTNNVTRATFETVRNNPGITRAEALQQLQAQGFKESSSSSLVTAFLQQGQFELVDGKLFTTSNEYTPLKSGKTRREMVSKKPAVKAVKPLNPVKPNIAAQQPQATSVAQPKSITPNMVLETLNVKDAYALYKALEAMFTNN
jgi:hypothetical protein